MLLPESDIATATEATVHALVGAGIHVREVHAVGGSLEEVFAELTRDSAVSDPEEEEELSA